MPNIFTNAQRVTTAADTDAIIYTSPALTVTVIHSIYIDGSGAFTLKINGASGLPIASNITTTAGVPLIFDKPINLKAGDTLTVTTTTAGINMTLSMLQQS